MAGGGLNPFQKKCHLSNSPKSSEGFATPHDDRQLQMAFVNLKALEENCKALQKEMCRYEECLSKLQDIELGLSSSMLNCGLAREDALLRSLAECYHSAVYQMRDNTDNLKLLSRKTVADPVKKLNPEFATIANALKRRDSALRDCHNAKAKHEKAVKSSQSGGDGGKAAATTTTTSNNSQIGARAPPQRMAQRALEGAKEDFEAHNKLLLMEMPQFYEKRIDYFQNCLQALIRSQVNYYGETNSLFTHLSQTNSSSSYSKPTAAGSSQADAGRNTEGGDVDSRHGQSETAADKNYLEDMDRHLTAIKSLSIVGK